VVDNSAAPSYGAILDLTRQMLEAARNSDWDQLTTLEQARSRMAMQMADKRDENPMPPSEESAEIIRNILVCDEEIKARTETWLTELRAALDSVNTERKLFQTYNSGS